MWLDPFGSASHTFPMKRRNFLTTSAAAGAALFAGIPQRTLFALGKDNTYRANIGIQLYTLRNQLKSDVAGTIKAVAEAGYKQVEPYGFPDDNRIDLINTSRDAGLAVNSSHFNWDSVVNPDDEGVEAFESILTKAKNHKLTHLVVPYLTDRNRKTLDDYRKVAENCKKRREFNWPITITLSSLPPKGMMENAATIFSWKNFPPI